MSRFILSLLGGASLVCVSVLGLLPVLPRVAPFELSRCKDIVGATECFFSINPVYWAVFMLLIVGIGLPFFGALGRNFILNPVFLFGMVFVAVGLQGVFFGYLSFESCGSASFPSLCLAYHPEVFSLVVLVGMAVMTGIGYRSWREIQANPGPRT